MIGKAIKNLLLIGHSEKQSQINKPMSGEIVWGKKVKSLTDKINVTSSLLDLYDLLERHIGSLELWQRAEKINCLMALENEPLVCDFGDFELNHMKIELERLLDSQSAILFFSWDRLLAPFLGLGLQKKYPLVARCTLFHQEEKLSASLYEQSHLILTESILANKALIKCGIPKEKILFLPPTIPVFLKSTHSKSQVLDGLFEKKCIEVKENHCLIGIYSRFIPSKNIDFTLGILHDLWKLTPTFTVLLRGDFDSTGDAQEYVGYTEILKKKMEKWRSEPWLIWKKESLNYIQILDEYAACDLLISLSGSEGGSHTVAEWLGLGKAVILLNASTQFSLFSKGACFVDAKTSFCEGKTWFKKPDYQDAISKISKMISSSEMRKQYEKKALEWSSNFNEEKNLKRISLMMDFVSSFNASEQQRCKVSQLLVNQFDQDECDFS